MVIFKEISPIVEMEGPYVSVKTPKCLPPTFGIVFVFLTKINNEPNNHSALILMGFFEKLFGKKETAETTETKPDNTVLIDLIRTYNKTTDVDDYKKVINELMTGNSFLLLPSINEGTPYEGWKMTEKGAKLKLKSIFNIDGLKVLGAFTSENTLLQWAKESRQYTGMHSKDVIAFCEENLIDRVVIDNDTDTFFVLERNRQNIKTLTIEKRTEVQIGTPLKPLDPRITHKLTEHFKRVSTIEEVYQYGQTKDGEFSIVLGFKLSVNSENAKAATFNAVQSALENEHLDQLLDLFIIDDAGWYKSISEIKDSLIYKKP